MPVPEERAAVVRRRKLLNLRRARGVLGLSYGMSAFGYPLGSITGVQGPPTDPPVSPAQFGDTGIVAPDSASSDSGGAPA